MQQPIYQVYVLTWSLSTTANSDYLSLIFLAGNIILSRATTGKVITPWAITIISECPVNIGTSVKFKRDGWVCAVRTTHSIRGYKSYELYMIIPANSMKGVRFPCLQKTGYEVWWQRLTSYKGYPSTLTNMVLWPQFKIVAKQLSSYNPKSQKKQVNHVRAEETGWAGQAGQAGEMPVKLVKQVRQARPSRQPKCVNLSLVTDEEPDGKRKEEAWNTQLENRSNDSWQTGNLMTKRKPKNAENQPTSCHRKHLKMNQARAIDTALSNEQEDNSGKRIDIIFEDEKPKRRVRRLAFPSSSL